MVFNAGCNEQVFFVVFEKT